MFYVCSIRLLALHNYASVCVCASNFHKRSIKTQCSDTKNNFEFHSKNQLYLYSLICILKSLCLTIESTYIHKYLILPTHCIDIRCGEVYLLCLFPKCQNRKCKFFFCLKLPNSLRNKIIFFGNDKFESIKIKRSM